MCSDMGRAHRPGLHCIAFSKVLVTHNPPLPPIHHNDYSQYQIYLQVLSNFASIFLVVLTHYLVATHSLSINQLII